MSGTLDGLAQSHQLDLEFVCTICVRNSSGVETDDLDRQKTHVGK